MCQALCSVDMSLNETQNLPWRRGGSCVITHTHTHTRLSCVLGHSWNLKVKEVSQAREGEQTAPLKHGSGKWLVWGPGTTPAWPMVQRGSAQALRVVLC